MTHGAPAILEPQALRYDAAAATVRLVGSECTRCGRHYFPPRRRCAACATETLRSRELSPHGQIASFTRLHRTPRDAWVTAPFTIAEVLLPEGLVVYGHLIDSDWEELRIGMPVELVPFPVSGPHGEQVMAYGFRPVRDRKAGRA